jgi:choline transport protein
MGDERSASEKGEATPDVAEKPHASDVLVNASGHKQELERNFSLLSICAVAVTTGNTWIALGGGLVCDHLFPFTRTPLGYIPLL